MRNENDASQKAINGARGGLLCSGRLFSLHRRNAIKQFLQLSRTIGQLLQNGRLGAWKRAQPWPGSSA
jgi:hypothetical protein